MDRQLAALATAHGVATRYVDSDHRRRTVRRTTVVGVLDLLGVDASSPAAVDSSLSAARAAADPDRLPPTVVLRAGSSRPLARPGRVTLEDGTTRDVGRRLGADLPLGWHRLACGDQDVALVVVPRRLPAPPPSWGWMIQLYALRSAASWGMGDLGDLREFTRWAGANAGFVLVNPLHAVALGHPVPASPYSPSSRRFANPLYLRVADTAEFRTADDDLRGRVTALRPTDRDPIDYDEAWSAKLAALELLFPRADPVDLDADPDLAAFATYCALAERYGGDWRRWPADVRHPHAAGVAAAQRNLADRIAFHAWLQSLCAEQLGGAAGTASSTGMPIGIVHDLAVGVDPGGADGWMLADVLAADVRVGAPPDAFNQLGQDWGLAAWRPDRLAATGYAAYRDMLRRIMRHGGGLRVDHVAGLFRLWWIPPGASAADGTYVRYDAEAMLGILALEAQRAGVAVIGEDLGTVQPTVTRGLRARNMLGSTVLWFARDWAEPGAPFRAPADWPSSALASVSTHDLPTAYGFLHAEHVRARAELGLLTSSVADELVRAHDDRARLLAMLRANGLLATSATADEDDDIVTAMHAALAASPSRLVAASLYDVLGEPRQPNMPGTTDEYPNWRLPLPVPLEEIMVDRRVTSVADRLAASRPRVETAPTASDRATRLR